MTLSVGMRSTGLKEVRALYGKMLDGMVSWQRTRIGASSALPYAYWASEGKYWGGRPGTHANATHYFARAMADVLPTIGPRIAAALPHGGAAVSAEAQKISAEIAVLAQGYAQERSGRLRASIRPNRGQSLRSVG